FHPADLLPQVRRQVDGEVGDLWRYLDHNRGEHPVAVVRSAAVRSVLVGIGVPRHFTALGRRPIETAAAHDFVHCAACAASVPQLIESELSLLSITENKRFPIFGSPA